MINEKTDCKGTALKRSVGASTLKATVSMITMFGDVKTSDREALVSLQDQLRSLVNNDLKHSQKEFEAFPVSFS